MVEDANKISGAMGMAAKESTGFENVVGNLNQSWKDLKAVIGAPIMDKAIEQMVSLTHWLGRIDGQKIADSLMGGVAYLNDSFGPLLGEITEDVKTVWGVLSAGEVESGLKTAFDGIQTSMQWLGDNWEGIKEGIFALTAGFIAYNAALAGAMILGPLNTMMRLYNSGMLLAAIQVKALTAGQWLLNAAMAVSPVGLVAVAIGGLVAVGVLLYRNWDIVREKTEQLWFKLGEFQGVATNILGPIGFIIRAAVTMADQWDSTQSVWENIWHGIKLAAENSINDIIGSVNWLIETINKIPMIDIPTFGAVDFADERGSTFSTGKTGMGMGVQGFATGLERVPYDNMPALLHKNESVLTAEQSDRLRGMGVLKSSGEKPVLNTAPLAGQRTATGQSMTRSQARKASNITFGDIIINGANKTTKEMARDLVDELKYVISAGGLA